MDAHGKIERDVWGGKIKMAFALKIKVICYSRLGVNSLGLISSLPMH